MLHAARLPQGFALLEHRDEFVSLPVLRLEDVTFDDQWLLLSWTSLRTRRDTGAATAAQDHDFGKKVTGPAHRPRTTRAPA